MKINYQRGENLKKKKKVGKLSTSMKSRRSSFCHFKKMNKRKFRSETKHMLRNKKYDLLPVYKKRIWWDYI